MIDPQFLEDFPIEESYTIPQNGTMKIKYLNLKKSLFLVSHGT